MSASTLDDGPPLAMRMALWAYLLQGKPTPAEIRVEFRQDQIVHFTVWAMQLDHFPKSEEIISAFHVSRHTAWRWRTWLATALAKRRPPAWEEAREQRA
jgi:hypothetical protein